jgi:hypothetical protein
MRPPRDRQTAFDSVARVDARGKRQVIIAASLLIVAAIGTTTFFVIRTQQRSDDVAEAAHVASVFSKQVSTYRSSVQSALTSTDSDNAKKLKVAFEAAVARAPKLGDAPEWGATHSRAYLTAKKTEKTLKEPYEEVSEVLDDAVVGQPFIKAADAALDVRFDDYIKGNTFYNGGPIRDKLIPGFKKNLAKFDKVEVPEGQAAVARKVRSALKQVIRDAEKAADDLDSGHSTSIDARSDYAVARAAVYAYEDSLEARLNSVITEAGKEVSGQPTESAT